MFTFVFYLSDVTVFMVWVTLEITVFDMTVFVMTVEVLLVRARVLLYSISYVHIWAAFSCRKSLVSGQTQFSKIGLTSSIFFWLIIFKQGTKSISFVSDFSSYQLRMGIPFSGWNI